MESTMSIRTLRTEDAGDRTIACVEVTYELPGRGQNYTAWEFSCDACDVMHTGLRESEARDELENHVCSKPS